MTSRFSDRFWDSLPFTGPAYAADRLADEWIEIRDVGFRHLNGNEVFSYAQIVHDRGLNVSGHIRSLARDRLEEERMACYYGLTTAQFRRLKEEGP